MKLSMKSTLTSTGKASVEFEVEEATSVQEVIDTFDEMKEQALSRYGELNSRIS